MSTTIDYYFSMVSPWAYIGHDALHAMAERHGVTITYRPVALMSVFERAGSLPLGQRHPTRQSLRWLELQRWREKRGLDLTLQPAHWPYDATTADRTVIAAIAAGHAPAGLIRAIYAGTWEQENNLGDDAVLAATADAAGLPGTELVEASRSDAVVGTYDENTEALIAIGGFGSPSYVLNGELFWGQDRIDLLEDAIASGREPYRPL